MKNRFVNLILLRNERMYCIIMEGTNAIKGTPSSFPSSQSSFFMNSEYVVSVAFLQGGSLGYRAMLLTVIGDLKAATKFQVETL